MLGIMHLLLNMDVTNRPGVPIALRGCSVELNETPLWTARHCLNIIASACRQTWKSSTSYNSFSPPPVAVAASQAIFSETVTSPS
jgi:hypothetical protein